MAELPVWARRLGPRQLQILLTIAETGSLSRAAVLMATTQPGLSKWLKELESALGVVLFERTTRRLAPTEYGQIVLRLADQVLGDTARMHDELLARKSGRLGRVEVGMVPGLAPALLPDALDALLQQGLQIEVVLREASLDVLLPQLQQHKLDVLVTRFDQEALKAGGWRQALFQETVCVMASTAHPLHQQPALGWQDLADQPWVLPVTGSPMRQLIDRVFEQAGVPTPCGILESTSALTNRAIACRLGALFVTSRLGADALERDGSVRRLPLVAMQAPMTVGVLWMVEDLAPQHLSVIQALQRVADGLREQAVDPAVVLAPA